MRKISLILVGALFMVVHTTAQDNLQKAEGTGIHTSDEVYINDKEEYFSRVFYIAFEEHVTENILQAKNIRSSNIRPEFAAFENIFSKLERNHGLQQMDRLYPKAVPNDTIRYSKKGERVVVSDLSKYTD